MYFFLFISIHIAAAVDASRDSEEGEAGMPEYKFRHSHPRQKKGQSHARRKDIQEKKKFNKLHHRNNWVKEKKIEIKTVVSWQSLALGFFRWWFYREFWAQQNM